jgi:ankyrin repeat protein
MEVLRRVANERKVGVVGVQEAPPREFHEIARQSSFLAFCQHAALKGELDMRDDWNMTLLHYAVWYGHPDAVEYLLQHGANVAATGTYWDVPEVTGLTPLHLACWKPDVEITRILLDWGAPIAQRDNGAETPLHYASYAGSLEIVRLLIERGANADVSDHQGQKPVDLAGREGHTSVVEFFGARAHLDHGG